MSAAPVVPFPEAAHLILSKQGNAAVNSESELVEKLRHPETRASKREHQRKKGSTGKKGKIFVEPDAMLSISERVNSMEEAAIAKKHERQSRLVASITEQETKKVSKRKKQNDYIKRVKDSLETADDPRKRKGATAKASAKKGPAGSHKRPKSTKRSK